MKKKIRLTEGHLHRIIKESVRRILREQNDIANMARWYEGLEDNICGYDVSAYIDVDDPNESYFAINGNEIGHMIDGYYGDTPFEELQGIYRIDGENGRSDVNSTMAMYLRNGER